MSHSLTHYSVDLARRHRIHFIFEIIFAQKWKFSISFDSKALNWSCLCSYYLMVSSIAHSKWSALNDWASFKGFFVIFPVAFGDEKSGIKVFDRVSEANEADAHGHRHHGHIRTDNKPYIEGDIHVNATIGKSTALTCHVHNVKSYKVCNGLPNLPKT